MYNLSEIKSIRVRYMDGTERTLNEDEIKNICNIANDKNDSIERILMKQELKPVRYVEINPVEYKPRISDNKVLKPLPPY